MKYFFCFFYILLNVNAFAQKEIIIQGTIAGFPANIQRTALLERHFGDGWKSIDSTIMDAKDYFAFKKQTLESGFYRIGFRKEGHPIEFMVGELEPEIKFEAPYTQMLERKVEPKDSKEAKAWNALKQLQNQDAMAVQATLADPKAFASNLEQSVTNLAAFRKFYHGTYCEKVLSTMMWQKAINTDPQYPGETGLYLNHLLKHIDFGNPHVLNNKIFKQTLVEFSNVCTRSYNDNRTLTDILMRLTGKNEIVTSFVFKFLLEKYISERNDKAANYLLNNFSAGCSDSEDPLQAAQLSRAMKACETGKVVQELELQDINGAPQKLSEVYKNHKITLITFWRTTCQHCVQTMPKLEQLYKELEPKGLGIYAVSLDQKPMEWSGYVLRSGLTFANVICPKSFFKNNLMEHYPVSGTPYMLLVDKEGKVLDRLVSSAEMESLIRDGLK